MDAKDTAEQIASVLETLYEYNWDDGDEAQQQTVSALNELYQQLWRENPGVPERRWFVTNKPPAYVWQGLQVHRPDKCPHCKTLLVPFGLLQDMLMCPDCDYRTLK